MQLAQDILLIKRRYYLGVQVAFLLFQSADQNTVRLITFLVPNDHQAIKGGVCLHLDKNFG